MKIYDRLFGSGPTGFVLSLILLAMALFFEEASGLPPLNLSYTSRKLFLILTVIVGVAIIFWSVRSLPPENRGRRLCKSGAFQYMRHPLYGAFLSCLNFGLAFYLNHSIYIIWALLLHPLWHFVIRREENLMRGVFPDEYDQYCESTGRFFPRLFSKDKF